MAVGSLFILPLTICASVLASKHDPNRAKFRKEEVAADDSQILANDSIMNYKTVSSFGSDEILMKEYTDALELSKASHNRTARISGFFFGYS